jgi:hypothetical protein
MINRVPVDDPDDPLDSLSWWPTDAETCPEYVGLAQSRAMESAEQNDRFSDIRVLDLDETGPSFWHMDRRPNRFNLVVRDGIVIAGALF